MAKLSMSFYLFIAILCAKISYLVCIGQARGVPPSSTQVYVHNWSVKSISENILSEVETRVSLYNGSANHIFGLSKPL